MAAMKERRISTRQKSFLQGRIYFNHRRSSIDCLVRDISEIGAKLKFSETIPVPEVMELYIPNKDEFFRARIQWRSGDEIGVAFEPEDMASPALAPGAPAAPAGDLAARVQRLEREVASLTRKVNELQADLRLRQGSDI
jgi:PilZ domain-containing protein